MVSPSIICNEHFKLNNWWTLCHVCTSLVPPILRTHDVWGGTWTCQNLKMPESNFVKFEKYHNSENVTVWIFWTYHNFENLSEPEDVIHSAQSWTVSEIKRVWILNIGKCQKRKKMLEASLLNFSTFGEHCHLHVQIRTSSALPYSWVFTIIIF